MADPQPQDPHLRLAHSILEQMMTSDFTKRQMSILLFVLRLSWGCGKKYAVIPKQKDFEIAGISESKIKVELEILKRDLVITVEGDRYSFNKDYDQWRVSRARGYDQSKLAKMVSSNIETSKQGLPKEQETTSQNSKPPMPTRSYIEITKTSSTISMGDMDILTVWQGVEGFNLVEEKQLELLVRLKMEFKDINLLEESKKWAARKLGDTLKKGSVPQQQIWNWMVKAREFQGAKPVAKVPGYKTKGVEVIE